MAHSPFEVLKAFWIGKGGPEVARVTALPMLPAEKLRLRCLELACERANIATRLHSDGRLSFEEIAPIINVPELAERYVRFVQTGGADA